MIADHVGLFLSNVILCLLKAFFLKLTISVYDVSLLECKDKDGIKGDKNV